jgi:uncharacterized protein YecE (DUF72 family)
MTGTLRIGTASWTDPTLTRDTDWYPRKSMSAEDRLKHYASIYTMVEVDATYYYPPTQDLAGKWVDRTPDDFRFDVKAFSLLTHHPAKVDAVWEEVVAALPSEHRDKRRVYLEHLPEEAVDRAFARFAEALLPLESAGKLGAVFFQLPPWFVASRDNRRYVESLPDRLPQYQLAVEFRHHSWLDDDTAPRTLELLERRGLAHVCVDGPQGFASSVPPVVAATADLAVVRFHGHNAETWEKKGISAAERFAYRYDTDELGAWAGRITDLREQAAETHAVFNNCYRDYGVVNARQFGQLLDAGLQPDAPPDEPELL